MGSNGSKKPGASEEEKLIQSLVEVERFKAELVRKEAEKEAGIHEQKAWKLREELDRFRREGISNVKLEIEYSWNVVYMDDNKKEWMSIGNYTDNENLIFSPNSINIFLQKVFDNRILFYLLNEEKIQHARPAYCSSHFHERYLASHDLRASLDMFGINLQKNGKIWYVEKKYKSDFFSDSFGSYFLELFNKYSSKLAEKFKEHFCRTYEGEKVSEFKK